MKLLTLNMFKTKIFSLDQNTFEILRLEYLTKMIQNFKILKKLIPIKDFLIELKRKIPK
jgi:hypothetical protein